MNKIETVYIIDDDEVYTYAIKRLISIQKLCENVVVFTNGKEAIDYFKNEELLNDLTSKIILLDVKMPIMDGWGFIEEFVKLNYTSKNNFDLFMISSSIDPKDTKRAESIALIKKYIFKPITFDELKFIFSRE